MGVCWVAKLLVVAMDEVWHQVYLHCMHGTSACWDEVFLSCMGAEHCCMVVVLHINSTPCVCISWHLALLTTLHQRKNIINIIKL